MKSIKKEVSLGIAILWRHVYQFQYLVTRWGGKYGIIVLSITLFLLISLSVFLSENIQNILEHYYNTDQKIERFRALLLSIGSALIGATAIVSSLVLFSMQVNIERMPHGLFHRLSSDWKLLISFVISFFLAIGIATSSTFISAYNLSIAAIATFWSVIIVLVLFLYSYTRALDLVNPLKQLGILLEGTKKEFLIWGRRAERARPLLAQEVNTDDSTLPLDTTHDIPCVSYFQINSHWLDGAKSSIRHAMSFAQRYAEQGDHEVSGASLNTVVKINSEYVITKGGTFFATNPFVDNPQSTDGFINDTLEHLRQYAQTAIVRRDEQQIEQTFQAISALVQVYIGIDYSSLTAKKTHAHLAAGYLSGAVQAAVPHKMPDVLMEGLRLMGKSVRMILRHEGPNEVSTLCENIAVIASTGAAMKEYQPVTLQGMTQLSDLTFDLLRTKNHDIHFAAEDIRKNISLIVKNFLNVPETPLTRIHSTYLGPYYSSTSTQSLRAQLTDLTNAISSSDSDDQNAQMIIKNIERWADGIYRIEKELLLAAVKARSHFTLDMVNWIIGITEIFCVASRAPACDGYTQAKLREHAVWLVRTLTWIPNDEETVKFMENFQMTETLFEVALNAHRHGCDEIAEGGRQALLSWTFNGGKYQTGWGIFERGLYGLSILALLGGVDRISELKSAVSIKLACESAPSMEIRHRTAGDISKRADSLYREGHWSSSIEISISKAEHEKLRPLLIEMSALLLPESS